MNLRCRVEVLKGPLPCLMPNASDVFKRPPIPPSRGNSNSRQTGQPDRPFELHPLVWSLACLVSSPQMLYLWISREREQLSSWSESILLFGSEETLPFPTWVNEILTAGIDFLEAKQGIVVLKDYNPLATICIPCWEARGSSN